ncbi:MAG: energy-coupling factor transporter ATPase [Coriobacteriales bacterium]|nr:energy-coupling factor transporter ATPase [Coriobacteriales bacterium]
MSNTKARMSCETKATEGSAVAFVHEDNGASYEGDPVIFNCVTYSYDNKTNALEDISLTVERGQYVAIVGGNGSGKSTLGKLVNALYLPDSGTVTVMGLTTSNEDSVFEIRRRAGLVFQNPDDQMITSLVIDDVSFGPENLGLPVETIKERAAQSLHEVGMDGFERRETYNLSGGQKQRVAIAGILAMNPDLIVLDEPGAMLDPRGRRGIIRVSHELNKAGVTVVLITHFMDEALLADRVVVVDHGKIAMDGTPAEVFVQHERLKELQLDEPFAVRLTAALRERGVYVPYTINENKLMEALCL